MKVIILVYFGIAFAYYDENNSSLKNLFEPARPNYESRTPMKTNRGMFFHPATFLPRFAMDNLHEQVLNTQRDKREAAGALHIMTNHAQPIHADVKPGGSAIAVTEKVTAPDDTFYQLKSLRKSWPFPNKLELARSISRGITLAVLVVSAIVEFFPLLKSLYYTVLVRKMRKERIYLGLARVGGGSTLKERRPFARFRTVNLLRVTEGADAREGDWFYESN